MFDFLSQDSESTGKTASKQTGLTPCAFSSECCSSENHLSVYLMDIFVAFHEELTFLMFRQITGVFCPRFFLIFEVRKGEQWF